jgi:serine/threonine protein kinase
MVPDQLLGKKFGNYVATELLGAGGMGAVYLAEHPQIRRRVAIKVISRLLSEDPEGSQRFLTEAQAVAEIEHANIVQVFDFGRTEDGYLYTVMEYLKGEDLFKHLRKGPISAGEALPYVEQICTGLQAAHDRRVIHRDLKPANIFVLDGLALKIKLVDFGLAKLLGPDADGWKTETGVVFGTPRYMAPEQAAGETSHVGPATDIYSLGTVIYEMLAGRTPFEGSAAGTVLAKQITAKPPALSDICSQVSPAIEALVHRCLAKQPSQRPASAMNLAELYAASLNATQSLPPDIASKAAVAQIDFIDPIAATLPSGSVEPILSDGGVANRAWPFILVLGLAAVGSGIWLAYGLSQNRQAAVGELTQAAKRKTLGIAVDLGSGDSQPVQRRAVNLESTAVQAKTVPPKKNKRSKTRRIKTASMNRKTPLDAGGAPSRRDAGRPTSAIHADARSAKTPLPQKAKERPPKVPNHVGEGTIGF